MCSSGVKKIVSSIDSAASSVVSQAAFGISHNPHNKQVQNDQLQKKQDIKIRVDTDQADQISNKKDMRLRDNNRQTVKENTNHKDLDNPEYAKKASGSVPGKPLFSANNMSTLMQFNDHKTVKIKTESALRNKEQVNAGIDQDIQLAKKDAKIAQNKFDTNKSLYKDYAGSSAEDLKPKIDTPSVNLSQGNGQAEDTNKLKVAREALEKLKGLENASKQSGLSLDANKFKNAELSAKNEMGLQLTKSLNKVAQQAKENNSVNLSKNNSSNDQDKLTGNQDIENAGAAIRDRAGKEFSSSNIGF